MRSAERISPRQTLRLALRRSARRLETAGVCFGHGTTNARDEAAWLVLHALHLPPDDPAADLARVLTPAEMVRVEALIEERVRTRKPAAYLTHEAWLGDYRFYVDERVIVPRSYIAELLRQDLRPWIANPAQVRHVLDLCTGSACLAILLAKTFRNARIDAADISPAALEVGRRNVRDYHLGARIRIVRSDLYARIRTRRYDLIVSNPPYVREAVMRKLPAEYRREPALALAGGHDGLDLVRTIVSQARAHLTEGGLLVVEVGHNRKRVEKAFPTLPFMWPATSGGDDCIFTITREALNVASRAHSPRATREGASPRPRGAGSPARASGAAAARQRRNARASGGSR